MHIIRLRRPWLKSFEDETSEARVDVPDTSEPNDTQGRQVIYRRTFNRPSGLELSSRVYLRVAGWHGALESARVNETVLPTGADHLDAEVTALLRPHNQVVITLSSQPGQTARLSGEVTLAIDD